MRYKQHVLRDKKLILLTSTSIFQPSVNLSASNIQSSMCLPMVQLPNFNGYILKWPEFWDTYFYESSVQRQYTVFALMFEGLYFHKIRGIGANS